MELYEDDLELYGKYKAKITDELWQQVKGPSGRKTGSGNCHQSDSGRRRKDHHQRWPGQMLLDKTGKKDHDRAA